MHSVKGIHHVSAIISDLYKNFSFFTGILGLKLVKQTVNFDNPEVYHLYYGDEAGTPGSLITFFPYSNLPQGRHGKKMMNTLGLRLSAGSLDFWLERLENRSVMYKPPVERFRGEIVVYLEVSGNGTATLNRQTDTQSNDIIQRTGKGILKTQAHPPPTTFDRFSFLVTTMSELVTSVFYAYMTFAIVKSCITIKSNDDEKNHIRHIYNLRTLISFYV